MALWQARYVADRLRECDPSLDIRLEVVRTRGDKILDAPLAQVGGKGLFVKEIEDALLEGRADLAVHSMKDVPTELPAALHIAAIPERADARDVLISPYGSIEQLPQGARVGTSSLRRSCQLRAARADLQIVTLRGNVDTRLHKLDEGHYAAIILAAAGLERLGYGDRISAYLDAPWVPAIGQGALGLETRRDDAGTNALVRRLHDASTASCVAAERALLRRLEGGCQVPIGAHASLDGETLSLVAIVGHPRGTPMYRGQVSGPADRAEELGRNLAEDLLEQGAQEVLAEVYNT